MGTGRRQQHRHRHRHLLLRQCRLPLRLSARCARAAHRIARARASTPRSWTARARGCRCVAAPRPSLAAETHESPPTLRPPAALLSDGDLGLAFGRWLGPCFRTVTGASVRARRRRRTSGRLGRRTCAWATWWRQGSISPAPSSCCRSRRQTCTMYPPRPHSSMLTTHACMGEAQAQLLRLLGTRLTGSGRLGTCRGRARATARPPDASAS